MLAAISTRMQFGTEMDFRRLITGTVVYAFSGAAGRIATLILLPAYTAHIQPAEYGVVALLTAFGAFLSSIATLGLGTSIAVSYYDTALPEERDQVISSANGILLLSAILVGSIGWLTRDRISILLTSTDVYATHAAIAIIAVALSIVAVPWQLKLQFAQQHGRAVLATLANLLISTILSLYLVIVANWSSLGLLTGAMGGQLAGALTTILLARGSPLEFGTLKHRRDLLRHGIPMLPSFSLVFLLQNGVRFPLEWIHGASAVGIYAIGSMIGGSVSILFSAFTTAWVPMMLEWNSSDRQRSGDIGRIAGIYLILASHFVSIYFLFSNQLIRIFTHAQYESAASAVGLSAAAQLFLSLFTMQTPSLNVIRRADNVVTTMSCALLVGAISAAILIPLHSVFGAAAAVAVAFFSLAVFQLISNRILNAPTPDYETVRIALAIFVLASISSITFMLEPQAIMVRIALALGSGIATVALIFAFRR